MKPLLLYSRPGCHLCELLYEELLALTAGAAVVEHIDIGQDPELERRYGLRIPVLACPDGELSGFPLDRARVAAYLSGT